MFTILFQVDHTPSVYDVFMVVYGVFKQYERKSIRIENIYEFIKEGSRFAISRHPNLINLLACDKNSTVGC